MSGGSRNVPQSAHCGATSRRSFAACQNGSVSWSIAIRTCSPRDAWSASVAVGGAHRSRPRISPLVGSAAGPPVTSASSASCDLVDGGAAQLLDAFHDVGHADDVGLGELTAVRIHRNRARLASAVPIAPLSTNGRPRPSAEAVLLELHQHHRREVVVDQRDVDVGCANAGLFVEPLGDRPCARGRERTRPACRTRRTPGPSRGCRRGRRRRPGPAAASGHGPARCEVVTIATAPSVSRQKS